jgi:hypothetical protein
MSELYFHVGCVVPDLHAAMDELSAHLGVVWREPRDRESGDMRWRLVYSKGEAPFIELVEGQPGTPWYAPDGPHFHHVGRFTYDLDESIREFEALGGRIEVDGREISGRWLYYRLPVTNVLIELIEADDEGRRLRHGIEPTKPA